MTAGRDTAPRWKTPTLPQLRGSHREGQAGSRTAHTGDAIPGFAQRRAPSLSPARGPLLQFPFSSPLSSEDAEVREKRDEGEWPSPATQPT